MNTPITLSRPDDTPIREWDAWTRPKKKSHWVPGRSAMELAKAWFRDSEVTPPDELVRLLRSSNRLDELQFLRGTPELVTSLPERGEGRNHDLWLIGQTPSESVTVCIEAKADESFGDHTVAEYSASAMARRASGESTRVPERMGPQGYLWVKTPDSAAGLRVDSPWISLCHPWRRERVDNPWNARSSHTTGVLH